MTCEVVTDSEAETFQLGKQLARSLTAGDVVLLHGELGAGKTILVRGIAAGLGADRWRGSPTFALIHEYPATPSLVHADLYRLSGDEPGELGLEDYVAEGAVLVVEWANRAEEYLRRISERAPIEIDIEHVGQEVRRVRMSCSEARECLRNDT